VLKDFYCHPRKLGSTQIWILFIIDEETLDLQWLFEKITMIFNAQWAMDETLNLNPLFQLWKKLSFNALLCVHLSEFMEVVEVTMVQIMGSVEDERNFLIVTFMKTQLRNMICEHLDLVVLCMCDLFIVWIFFHMILPSWLGLKRRHEMVFWLESWQWHTFWMLFISSSVCNGYVDAHLIF
jgi:hypothetical protein